MICYRFSPGVLVWHPHPWGFPDTLKFPELSANPPAHVAAELAKHPNNVVSTTDPPEFKIIDVTIHW